MRECDIPPMPSSLSLSRPGGVCNGGVQCWGDLGGPQLQGIQSQIFQTYCSPPILGTPFPPPQTSLSLAFCKQLSWQDIGKTPETPNLGNPVFLRKMRRSSFFAYLFFGGGGGAWVGARSWRLCFLCSCGSGSAMPRTTIQRPKQETLWKCYLCARSRKAWAGVPLRAIEIGFPW